MDPRTIPEDIYALLDDDNHHTPSDENIEWAGELVKSLLRERLKKREKKSGESVLRLSSIGKKDRQIWYAANKPEVAEKMHGKQNFKFLYGDMIEVLLLFLAKEAGHEITHTQTEVNVDGVLGHTDAVIDGVPTDAKSASPYSFQKFKDGSFGFDDPFGYIPQLSGYAHALNKLDGTRKDRAGFLVAEKVSGDICFAEIDDLIIEGNPPAPRIEKLREVIRSINPPPRCYSDVPEGKSGNRKLSLGCSYCPVKTHCWADCNGGRGLRTFLYGRGPVFLTNVAREPKVNEA